MYKACPVLRWVRSIVKSVEFYTIPYVLVLGTMLEHYLLETRQNSTYRNSLTSLIMGWLTNASNELIDMRSQFGHAINLMGPIMSWLICGIFRYFDY